MLRSTLYEWLIPSEAGEGVMGPAARHACFTCSIDAASTNAEVKDATLYEWLIPSMLSSTMLLALNRKP